MNITVTTLLDVVNAGDGQTSLREAVAQATAPGSTINFSQGLFNTTINGERKLQINSTLEISGGRNLTINGDFDNNGTPDFTLPGGIVVRAGSSLVLRGFIVNGTRTASAFEAPFLPFGGNGTPGLPAGIPGFESGPIDGNPGGHAPDAKDVYPLEAMNGRDGNTVGALVNAGSMKLDNVWFRSFTVQGGQGDAMNGGTGGNGSYGQLGGAGYSGSSKTRGGNGGNGGDGGNAGDGGAGAPVVNVSTGLLMIDDVMFSSTTGRGGNGGKGGNGGAGGKGGTPYYGAWTNNLNHMFGQSGTGGNGGKGGNGGAGAGTIINQGGTVRFDTAHVASGTTGAGGTFGAAGSAGLPGVLLSGESGFNYPILNQGLPGQPGISGTTNGVFSNTFVNQGGVANGASAALGGNMIFVHALNRTPDEGDPSGTLNSSSENYTFSIVRFGNLTQSASVTWELVHGTTSEDDFGFGQSFGQSVFIPAGEMAATFTVSILKDFVQETDETFHIRLQSIPAGYSQTGPNRVVTIQDDDSGTPGNDTIFGTTEADEIDALAGNDLVVGDTGADTMDGGAGNDTLDYGLDHFFHARRDEERSPVTVNLEAGWALDPSGGLDDISNFETIVGTGYHDIFRTAATNHNLTPQILKGEWGNDTFHVSSVASPRLSPVTPTAVLYGGEEDDSFHLGRHRVTAHGGPGKDLLNAGGYDFSDARILGLVIRVAAGKITRGSALNNYSIFQSGPLLGEFTGMEEIRGSTRADAILGGSSADILRGLGERDILDGGAGNDTIDGGADIDVLIDSAGNDTYLDSDGAVLRYFNSPKGVTINMETRKVTGNGNDNFALKIDTLEGTKFADVFHASDRVESLNGMEGDDTFHGTTKKSQIDGGEDKDTVTYEAGKKGIKYTENGFRLRSGIPKTAPTIRAEGHVIEKQNTKLGEGDFLMGIEILKGTKLADSFISAEWDVLRTLPGDPAGLRDLLPAGLVKNNKIEGGAGNDEFQGIYGNDTYDGGLGSDWFRAETHDVGPARPVTINLALGTARRATWLLRLDSMENAAGGSGNDSITGSFLANELPGNDGNDTIDGGGGNDTMDGGDGIDTAAFSSVNARIVANLTTGVATGQGTDSLVKFENVTGSAANDSLTGSAVANMLEGGDGNDTLTGGTGRDTLTGGLGADHFQIDKRDFVDLITDFQKGLDKIRVDDAILTQLSSPFPLGPIAATNFRSGVNPVATGAGQFLYRTGTGVLQFDGDGPGGFAPISIAQITNRPALTFTDIQVY